MHSNIPLFLLFQWKETDPSKLMDSKLKCVFKQPEDGANHRGEEAAAAANGASSDFQRQAGAPASQNVRKHGEKKV